MMDQDRTGSKHNKFESGTNEGHLDSATISKGLILLAEDNPVNQKIGLTQLRKLGYTAHGVSDGLEVLQTLSHRQDQNSYAIILMDCQMPNLDGFETTRAIRQQEKVMGNNQHIPIIALTANPMQGDREVCLAAGMDDYLTKPIVLEELEQRLDYWIKKTGPTEATSAPVQPTAASTMPPTEPKPAEQTAPAKNTIVPEEEPIDQKVLASLKKLQEVSGTPLLNQLIDLFLTDTPNRLAGMAKAIAEKDAYTLERIAHSLKGSCGNLGLRRMVPLARSLEEAGKAGQSVEVRPTLEQLEKEYCQAAETLEALKTDESSQAVSKI